jgi:hypothetical protein
VNERKFHSHHEDNNFSLPSRGRNSISIETVEVAFFVTGLETLQILGVEMSTGSTESNVRSFELSLLKKTSKKAKASLKIVIVTAAKENK